MPLGLQANASDSCLHFLPSSTNLPGMRKCSQSKGRASAEFTRELSLVKKLLEPSSISSPVHKKSINELHHGSGQPGSIHQVTAAQLPIVMEEDPG